MAEIKTIAFTFSTRSQAEAAANDLASMGLTNVHVGSSGNTEQTIYDSETIAGLTLFSPNHNNISNLVPGGHPQGVTLTASVPESRINDVNSVIMQYASQA